MASEPKKRKFNPPSRRRTASSPTANAPNAATSTSSLAVPAAQTSSETNFRIQQAKNFAIRQAQQDGCTGSYKIFDSPYGNFFVPVVPTRADLSE